MLSLTILTVAKQSAAVSLARSVTNMSVFNLLRERFWVFFATCTPHFTKSVQGYCGRVQDPETENFTQFRNRNFSQGRIPCAICTKFSAVVGSIMVG